MFHIKKEALNFILGVSKKIYPREFVGMLRAEGDTVTEVLVIPASTYGEGFAQTKNHMIPLDKTIVGSVHSHPTRNNRPSNMDLTYFRKTGSIHLIVRYPYESVGDVRAYNNMGEDIKLSVVEV